MLAKDVFQGGGGVVCIEVVVVAGGRGQFHSCKDISMASCARGVQCFFLFLSFQPLVTSLRGHNMCAHLSSTKCVTAK